MLINYMQQALGLLEEADAVLICDREGYVEYTRWHEDRYFSCQEVIGRHILEVYPTLTEETSTIMRCLKQGEGRIDDEQHLENFKGEQIHIVSTTLPILSGGQVIGALCASSFLDGKREEEKRADRQDCLHVLDDIVTENERMKELKLKIARAALNHANVLICGETGTGKQLVAESVHTCGERRGKPFVSQNCAAIPASLLESIFFGTEKGSYTGAETRKGLFELADGGTLFLDEVNSMDLQMQAKILKVLEEKRVRRLGGAADRRVDVKIICAMNEDPDQAVKDGRLREDFFYRISVIRLTVPPLRERREDIALLTDHFIRAFNREYRKQIKGLSELAARAFEEKRWRGNVRELRNTLESACINASGERITIRDLPERFLLPENSAAGAAGAFGEGSLAERVEAFERELIRETLNACGSVSEAARRLKLSRQRLRYKMDKYGM